MVWIIAIVILIIIILLLLTRIYLTVKLIYTTDERRVELRINVLRICIFRKQIPLESTSHREPIQLSFSTMKDILRREFDMVKELGKSANKVLRHLYFHKLVWHTEGGTGEAASTGLIAGGIWSIKGAITCYFVQQSTMKCKPVIRVIPHFQQQCYYTRFECIASLRIGQAIHALVYTIKNTAIKGEAIST
ncbi:DUF2953 domain-containing protein [Oceanobacillus kapialis]|uniref:DUF2953 domain-containing protein n=1 Tax=Oceanobacillus kapialis TaxID=481353 RepID=A0ABW5PWW0_9BACI